MSARLWMLGLQGQSISLQSFRVKSLLEFKDGCLWGQVVCLALQATRPQGLALESPCPCPCPCPRGRLTCCAPCGGIPPVVVALPLGKQASPFHRPPQPNLFLHPQPGPHPAHPSDVPVLVLTCPSALWIDEGRQPRKLS